MAAFTKAIRAFPTLPDNFSAYTNRGNAYSMRHKLDLALADYNAVLNSVANKDAKQLGEVYYNRGVAYQLNGKPELAIPDYRHAIAIDAMIHGVHNKLAWLLATNPKDSVRNGTEAVAVALVACEQTGNANAAYLDTLAAAYAEAGDFPHALTTMDAAIAHTAESDEQERTTYRQRRALYAQGKAYRADK